jgi:CzcA family heavy metal efflux pump
MAQEVTWAQRHRKSLLLAVFGLGASGLVSVLALPVSLFPQTAFPRVVVTADAGSRSVDRMEVEVTVPMEEAVRSVPGVRRVRSSTSRGSCEISVDFAWGTDMVSATLQVEAALNQARAVLPAATRFNVRRMDPTVFPVLGYTLTSQTRSSTELRELALYQLRPVLQTVQGVARVGVLGGGTREYQVIVDRDRLLAQGLDLDQVRAALASANDVLGVGRTEDLGHLYLVLGNTELSEPDAIAQAVVGVTGGGVVRVADVAEVQVAKRPQWIRVRADGMPAVIFQVYQQPDGDTTQIARSIGQRLRELQDRLPSDVHVATWYDQSELIIASATSVAHSLVVGVVLAFFVLLIFLRDFRVSMVTIVCVPVTLAVTALVLELADQTLNIMTLGGMAAAVGLVIDDALVMVEHLVRRLPRLQGSLARRIALGSREFIRPLAGSSMVTIIIFAPMAFVGGVSGAFFKPLALTLAVCLTISFLVALLAVPLLTQLLIAEHEGHSAERTRGQLAYGRLLAWVLPRPWLMLAVLGPVLALGVVGYQRTGRGFMPQVDEGGFVLDYVVPAGTSLTETDRRLREIARVLAGVPEVRTYSRRTGLSLSGGLREANEGDFFVRLVPPPRAPLEDVMERVRGQIEARVPGVEIEMALLMEDLIGDLTATPQPIEVKIFGDDYRALLDAGPRVAKAIEGVPGVVDVKSGVVLAGDAWEVAVDRDAAAIEGVSAAEVSRQLSLVLQGAVATSVQDGPRIVDVRVWTPHAQRTRLDALERMRLRAPDGHLFPLARVASVRASEGQAQVTREDMKRMVAVSGRIAGRDMGSVIHDVEAALAKPDLLPSHAYYRLGGLYEEQQRAVRSMSLAFGAALVLVFVVLLYLTERFRVALVTLVPAVGAAAGAFTGLWLTGIELNITAMMGLIMVVGIVTEVSVFFVFEATASRAGSAAESLVAAGMERVRPIIMTSLVASLALFPIAFGVGEGAAMLRPMAVAIIAGLAVKLPLALLVLPSALQWAGWRGQDHPAPT